MDHLSEPSMIVLKRTLIGLLFGIIVFSLLLSNIASADDDEDDGDDNDDGKELLGMDGEDLGSVAQVLFIFTLTIVVWKPGHIWLQKNAKDYFAEPKEVKKSLRKFNKIYMRLHYWIGFGAVVVGGVHGLATMSEDNGWMYWAGWAGMVIMSVTGALLLWKWPPKKVRKGARLIHAQRVMLVITIVLLVVAHD